MNKNWDISKDKDSLVEVLEEIGASFEGDQCTCPYHQDSNPSAGIFQDKETHWRFRCFVCDLTYDYYDIITRKGDTVDVATPKTNDTKEEREKHVYSEYEDALGDYTDAYRYLDTEGNLLVTKTRRFDTAKNRKTYRMTVPYYGGFIRKAPDPPWPLYNLLELSLRPHDAVLVVEGEKCADAAKELGILATTALSSTSTSQTDWTPLYGRKVVIWPDNDSTKAKFAGQKYGNAIERILMPHCQVTKVDPESLNMNESEDIVDYIERGHGSDDVKKVLNEAAKHTPSEGVGQYIEGMIDGSIRAMGWPWELLQRYSQALMPGTITVLCGCPGCGKSLWLMEAFDHWIAGGIRCALYALEENKTFHLLRALAQRSGVCELTEPGWVQANPEEARKAMAKWSGYLDMIGQFLYAQPNQQISLSDIFEWIHEQLDAGCRIVAVDPITAASREKDIWKADEEFILQSKKLADEYKASIIFVTHPTKQDATPYLGNLRGGAAYQQFVPNVFWLEKLQGIRHVELTDGSMVRVNRLLYILKARNAREMETGKLAYLMTKGLKFHEYGEFKKFED